MSDMTIHQHHVWQYHLKAWANKKEQVFCLRRGNPKPFLAHTSKLAGERFFYEFQELTEADEQYLNWVINQSNDEGLRKVNRGWVDTLQTSFSLRRKIADLPLSDAGRVVVERELVKIDKTLGESFHGGIENRGQPSLDALRLGDTSFYEDDEKSMAFIQFICVQYFRTSKIRDAMMAITMDLTHSTERTWPIEAFIYSTSVGAGLYARRREYSIVILDNASDKPFITGDQPVINILGKDDKEVELYYPVTPRRAIIFTANNELAPSKHRNVGLLEVENYNFHIYKKSGSQIFANDKDYLSSFNDLPKGELI